MDKESAAIELGKVEYDRENGHWSGEFTVRPKGRFSRFVMRASLSDGTHGTDLDGYPPKLTIEQASQRFRELLRAELQALLEASARGLQKIGPAPGAGGDE